MRLNLLLAAMVFLLLTHCVTESEPTYLERRAAFETNLLREGPVPKVRKLSPIMYGEDWELPMDRIQKVTYPSAGLDLNAWVYVPEEAHHTKAPAFVFFHGGRQFHEGSLRNCKPYIDRGFVVMIPTVRAHSGNPGVYELFLGEVDDAKTAIEWLARQPYVHSEQIYAFGWSYGGGMTSVLSLLDNVPVRHSASLGGLRSSEELMLGPLAGDMPFDISNPEELQIRTLIGNIRWMQHLHYAYVGSADTMLTASIAEARREIEGTDSLLRIITVPGDHFTSFHATMEGYLDLILKDIEGTT